ncbi:MAG: hypothetical protein M3Y76_08380, partial [Chloroflexota bacterium]|nr:hypothetical protein [Chloroflexota bacterium]
LEHTEANDRRYLREVYQQTPPITSEQVEEVLAIFTRSQTREYCCAYLAEQCRLATEALESVPRMGDVMALRAIGDMQTLVHFVAEASKK